MRLTSQTFVTGMLLGGVLGAAVAAMYTPTAGIAVSRRRTRREFRAQEQMVDDQSDMSFPASDPPSFTPTTSVNPS